MEIHHNHPTMARISLASSTLICIFVVIVTIASVGAFSPTSQILAPKSHVVTSTSSSSLSATTIAAVAPIATPPPTFSALFGLAFKRSTQDGSSLYPIPAIFNPADSRPIVLFDGKCNLCNAGVQLILDTDSASDDTRGNLRVAALQSRVGKVLISRLPEKQQKAVLSIMSSGEGGGTSYKSIVVAGKDQTWLNSAACIKIGKNLKGPLRILALLASIIPSFIRDPLYKLMSKYRKKLFGESPDCRLWDDNWDTRFVNDSIFGGQSEEGDDPFADPNAKKKEEEPEEDIDFEQAPGPNVVVGDTVRVIGSKPIVHTHVSGYESDGLCSVGLVGTVTRVLEQRAYPKSVAVKFDLKGDSIDGDDTSFEAHLFPGQLQKE